MNDEIRNQENLLHIANRIHSLLDKYPRNDGMRVMANSFTEVCIYIAGIESRNMELQLTLNKKKDEFKNKITKYMEEWN